jgi:hypothetical protein
MTKNGLRRRKTRNDNWPIFRAVDLLGEDTMTRRLDKLACYRVFTFRLLRQDPTTQQMIAPVRRFLPTDTIIQNKISCFRLLKYCYFEFVFHDFESVPSKVESEGTMCADVCGIVFSPLTNKGPIHEDTKWQNSAST